tara:strand:+ start:557 stop:2212 length:1656 start_codon:yes stop_codon:yes gene_type:complete
MEYFIKNDDGSYTKVGDSNELTILTTNEFIRDDQVDTAFINKKTDEPFSIVGNVTIKWLSDMANQGILQTQNREYQREKVANVEWCQGIIDTILFSKFARVPQLHIKVIVSSDGDFKIVSSYEKVDGQQRTRAGIIDFIMGEFPIGDKKDFPKSLYKGKDLSGKYFKDLKSIAPELYHNLLEYVIPCVWYGNLTDDNTSDLFIDVLNNVNGICAQEKRNALRGRLTQYMRDRARPADKGIPVHYEVHDLFKRVTIDGKDKLKYFGTFPLNKKMEVDEWLAELCYLKTKDWINGVSSKSLTDWYKETQKEGAKWNFKSNENEWKKSEKEFNELLDFGLELMSKLTKSQKAKLTKNPTLVFILYADELKNKYGKLDTNKYIKHFFKTWKEWSSTKLKKWVGKHFINKDGKLSSENLKPFNELFSGTATKSMATIKWVLEQGGDYESYGAIELDSRKSFSMKVKSNQYDEQEGKCYYTGEDVLYDEQVGDHFIPRAWGVKRGGVTEPHNCKITTKEINSLKDDKSPEEFAERLLENGYTLTEEFKKDLEERKNK